MGGVLGKLFGNRSNRSSLPEVLPAENLQQQAPSPSPSSAGSNSGDREFLKAIQSYERRTDGGDISFNKGDRMMLINNAAQNHGWFYVRTLDGKPEEGWVPEDCVAPDQSIEVEDWYHGSIPRFLADLRVCEPSLPSGAFLVRDSEKFPGCFTLVVKVSDGKKVVPKHYVTRRTEDGRYYIAQTKFKSLTELITFYRSNAERIGLACRLTDAVVKDTRHQFFITPDEFEIKRGDLEKYEKIGSGNFGAVYRGRWRRFVEVAIKEVKPNTMGTDECLKEAHTMRGCNHLNLVRLYGICSVDEPICIVTEFMVNGSLLDFLHLRCETNTMLPLASLLGISSQIANGMKYLGEQDTVHRDLAARNILVGKYNNDRRVPEVKIADFGLARVIINEDYKLRKEGVFPIKWTAPEALYDDHVFKLKSDVWSFGILLYEIITHGDVPYPGIKPSEVVTILKSGYRMKQPDNCPDLFYKVMRHCWHANPDARPNFQCLHAYLDEYSLYGNEFRKEFIIEY